MDGRGSLLPAKLVVFKEYIYLYFLRFLDNRYFHPDIRSRIGNSRPDHILLLDTALAIPVSSAS
jgi:hypothetical protein